MLKQTKLTGDHTQTKQDPAPLPPDKNRFNDIYFSGLVPEVRGVKASNGILIIPHFLCHKCSSTIRIVIGSPAHACPTSDECYMKTIANGFFKC